MPGLDDLEDAIRESLHARQTGLHAFHPEPMGNAPGAPIPMPRVSGPTTGAPPTLLGQVGPVAPRAQVPALPVAEEPSASPNWRPLQWHEMPLYRAGSMQRPIQNEDVGAVALPADWTGYVANGNRIGNVRYNQGRGDMDVELLDSGGRLRRSVAENESTARQAIIDTHNAALPRQQHLYDPSVEEPSTSPNWQRLDLSQPGSRPSSTSPGPQNDPFDTFLQQYMRANPGASLQEVSRAFQGQSSEKEPEKGEIRSTHFTFEGDEAKQHFEQHIAPKMDEKTFHDQYFGGYTLTRDKNDPGPGWAQIDDSDKEYGIPSSGLKFHGSLRDQQGNHVGQITRIIDPKNGEAYHSYLNVPKNLSGTGFNKNLAASHMRTYQQLGINKVSLTADIDAGSYAWAKYGYTPGQDDWDSLRSFLKVNPNRGGRYQSGTYLDDLKLHPEDHAAVTSILNNPNPKAMWDLADMQAKPLEDKSANARAARTEPLRYKNYKDWGIGKRMLFDQSWHGELHLDDDESMRRFWSYVGPQGK